MSQKAYERWVLNGGSDFKNLCMSGFELTYPDSGSTTIYCKNRVILLLPLKTISRQLCHI